MRFGLLTSILLHLAVIGAAFVSWPFLPRPDLVSEPYIPLELIREADLDLKTSVPAARPEPEPVEEEKPDLPEPVVEEEPPAPVEEKKPDPVVEEKPKEAPVIIEPEKKPDPKPTPPKPKPKDDELNFDDLQKLIDKERQEETARVVETPSETVETADQTRQAIGAGDRLTASDKAKMKAAVERCWNAGSIIGAPEPEKLRVEILIELNRDGSLAAQPKVTNALQINLSGNRFWKVAEQQALRAVANCAPYDFFPQDRYNDWKSFLLNFDPSEMVGR